MTLSAQWVATLILLPLAALAQSAGEAEITARITDKFAERVEQSDNLIRGSLVGSGLSAEDSIRISRAFANGMLTCLLDAARVQAGEQAVPYEDVLLAIEHAIDEPEADDPTFIDFDAIDDKAQACAEVEMQKAGISIEMIAEQQVESTRDSEQRSP